MLKERTSLVEVDPLLLRRTRGIFSATTTAPSKCDKVRASASANTFGEIWMRSAFAVPRLMISSNLEGCLHDR